MNIIEAIEKLKAQKFEPVKINGETILSPAEGCITRHSNNAVIDIECDIHGDPHISYYRTLPPCIEALTTWGRGGNMSQTGEWLVVNTVDNILCDDLTATDWEFEAYPPDDEQVREPDPEKDEIYCRYDCPGLGKDGCKVSRDYIPGSKCAIHPSCPYPHNKKLIAETMAKIAVEGVDE